jgi:SAM-dependent methyltransferase
MAMELITKCSNWNCSSRIIAANSARNFLNPSLAVEKALEKGILKNGQDVLEVGAGNLRTVSFISHKIKSACLRAFEVETTIQKFTENYASFLKAGGMIIPSFPNRTKYDAIICTFVLETICPKASRNYLLKKIHQSLKRGGILIASFRGVSGVIGSKYKECPKKEGWLTPLHTFIKPYTIKEIRSLLKSCGFSEVDFFQDYRVDTPKNIHLAAR